jgi:hypothetical protein
MRWCRTENINRLDKLNFYGGRPDGSDPCSLSITQLSFHYTQLPTPLDHASLPSLRHLSCTGPSYHSVRSILPLLPQITSLHLLGLTSNRNVDLMLSASTSLASLSISDYNLHLLNDLSSTIIKDRVEVLRVELSFRGIDVTKFVECIAGSKVMKKITLDRPTTISSVEMPGETLTKMKKVVEACKKKETIELWKGNYPVNGKVDLDADIVSFSLITVGPSFLLD